MDDALRLADELADPEARLYAYQLTQAAAELRRLHAENETLKQSVARLQQHHATAWNRGHTMGMKANEDTARRALDAVKQDAWGNTQLTEALLKAEEQRDALLEALKGFMDGAEAMGWNTLKARAAIALCEGLVAAVEGEAK